MITKTNGKIDVRRVQPRPRPEKAKPAQSPAGIPPINCCALAIEDGRSNKWHSIIEFQDVDRKSREIIVPRSTLRKRNEIVQVLDDAGYEVPQGKAEIDTLVGYLQSAKPKRRVRIRPQAGWVEDRFVLHDRVVGKGDEEIRYVPDLPRRSAGQSCSGTLDGWITGIAKPAACSSRMMFGLSAALGSVLLQPLKVESGAFHFAGPSSKGKTTLLLAAQSVFFRSVREDLLTWDVTDTGLEELAAEHCDMPLCLDEIAQIDRDINVAAKKVLDRAFKIASGQSRARSRRFGLSKDSVSWRVILLSTGERGITELVKKGGGVRQLGDQVRLIDIPADVGAGYGIYEKLLRRDMKPAEVSEAIEQTCAKHYGVAAQRFVEFLLNDSKTHLASVREWFDAFGELAGVPTHGWERRFAKRFALAYAAAMLGREAGVLPWSAEETRDAIVKVYRDARAFVPGYEELIEEAIGQIGAKLRAKKGFRDLRQNAKRIGQPKPEAARAFIKEDSAGNPIYLVTHDRLERWIGDRVSSDQVIRRLLNQGYIQPGSGQNTATAQVLITGVKGRRRYYQLRHKLLKRTSPDAIR